MRYYIADCHFFHAVLNEKMDKRGFSSVEEMNDYMLQKWNERVRTTDTVVVLGDITYGTPEENNALLDKLNGKIWLVQGNHDKFTTSAKYRTDRFEWIRPYEELQDNHRKVICSHYPIMCYNGQYHQKNDGSPKAYMLYGHVHDTVDQRLIEQFQNQTRLTKRIGFDEALHSIPCHMINCFCKYSDYTPLTLTEWIENDRKRMLERYPELYAEGKELYTPAQI